ncbi:MAG: hemolysin family protein [Chloroflexota bacterium]
MDVTSTALGVSIFVALLVVNAFFVAAEYAIVRVRPTQLQELAERGSARARVALRISAQLDRYISTVQVGVTGASLALGFVGEPAVSRAIAPAFGRLAPLSEPAYHVISFLVAFAIITYLTLVIGELAPKYIAIRAALPLALWTAYPLELCYRALRPFVWLVQSNASLLVSVLRIRPAGDLDAQSAEELKLLIAVSTRQGILQESERAILANALEFADRLVRQVMVPRTLLVAVEDDTTVEQIRELASTRRVSLLPVYHGDLDTVVGIVHLRDLASHVTGRTARDVMRPASYVPDTMRLDQALAEFKRQRSRLAIVIDEFGGTAGLVTLEDVVEELVGEIPGESDQEPAFREEAPGVFSVDGLLPLAELLERLDLELTGEPYDTVGGFVFGHLGREPRFGDSVDAEGMHLQVMRTEGRRIARLRVRRSPTPTRARFQA